MTDVKTTITTPGPSHIQLIMEARPRPGLSMNDLVKEFKDLNNPILDVKGRVLLAVDEIHKVDYSESLEQDKNAAPGELVWACEFCWAYSKWERVTVEHEKTCDRRPR
jgi:hypothetical protein